MSMAYIREQYGVPAREDGRVTYTGSGKPQKGTIIVAGLGRCGSSLVMRMLDAAGVPVVGSYPDYEDAVNMGLPALDAQRDFASRCAGKAVKLLDPHLHAPPIGLDYRCIFLTRHPVEQAKSILKLIGARGDRQARRAMESTVRRDTVRARNAVSHIGDGRYLELPFENVIHDPIDAASRITRYLAGWPVAREDAIPLNVEAMARCVRRRPATCLPYMLELELIPHA